MSIERVVVLGFMSSGKSSVGESLARRLGWSFLDFDSEIERRETRSVPAIIQSNGEGYFRELEAALTEEAAEQRRLVLAPGGGWITQPRLLEGMRAGTLSIWLRVSPEETVRRLMNDPRERPLKDDPNPVSKVAAMLGDRESLYRLADVMVPGDGRSVEEIAFEIEQIVRARRWIGE